MSKDLAAELRGLARQVSGDFAGSRTEAGHNFWNLARQFRAAFPPLLLPHRSGSGKRRIGYLAIKPERIPEYLEVLSSEHGTGDEDVWLYLLGARQGLPTVTWARAVELANLTELDAARLIAEADLDTLVDLDGAAMMVAPLIIALRPARAMVEPLFESALPRRDRLPAVDSNSGSDAAQQVQRARSAADRASGSALHPLNWSTELNGELKRAINMHGAGELDAARAAYENVLARCAEHPVAAYLLGNLLHQQGRSFEAISWLQRAARAAPEFRDAHYVLGQRLADARRWDEAASAYRCAVELTPSFAAGWSGMGLAVEHDSGQVGHPAIECLERAVALEPDTAQWRFNLGTILQRSGDLTAAREAYEQALVIDPEQMEARFNLGAAAQDQGDYPAAIAAYRAVLRQQPGFAAVYPQLGACLQLTGWIEAWLENFGRFRASCPESLPMAVYGLEASMAAGDPVAHEHWRERVLAGSFLPVDPEE
ncbi:MAG: tetratricopeptide repeat protein [Acidobacteriota bacterium]